MVAFRNLETRPILGRGPSVLLRFIFFALLSFGLMWLDQRHSYLERIRYGFSVAAYPFQVLVNSPGAAWDWLDESFATRGRLQKENDELRVRLRQADLRSMRLEALERENLRLRNMQKATVGIADRVMVAEIMRVDLNPLRHRVILSKGASNGVFKGQPVLDSTGVFGQITRAGAFTSEAILISDFEHAIPVQVNRNGLRTIAVGTGDLTRLSLPFLPVTADVKEGDLLVTSGLGGVFPQGYPVATITDVNSEVAQTLATVTARPAATLDRDREVLLVWVKQPPIVLDPPVGAAKPPAPTPAKPAAPPARPTGTQTAPTQSRPAPSAPAPRPVPSTRTPEGDAPGQTTPAPPADTAQPTPSEEPPARDETAAPEPSGEAVPDTETPQAEPGAETPPAPPPEPEEEEDETEPAPPPPEESMA